MRPRAQLLDVVLLVAAFLFIPAIAANEPAARDIDVGGYRLHCVIEGIGSPAVVFENGMGEPLATWKNVQPAIAKMTTTVMYDRGGLGESQPAPGSAPRTVKDLLDELHQLLRAAGIPGPYILVGHSLGGAVIEFFAQTYPSEIAGLILVDPEDGRLTTLLKSKLAPDVWAAREKMLSTDTLPPAIKREFDGMSRSDDAARSPQFPRVPVVLLTGTEKNPGFPGNPTEQDLKLGLHNELAERIPGIEHILVPDSRHYIQDDAPDKVIQAIERVLAQARRRRDRPNR